MEFKNRVKEKITSGEAALGGWCMTASAISAEIMAGAGFDWVCVDAEHSAVNMETIQNIFTAVENKGAEPFVRIALNDEVECKKVLDAGAKGVIVPMIKSYEDVERAVSYVKYAPVGSRSFALPRSTGYGAYAEEYFQTANETIYLVIMLEHIDVLKDLDRILANKHIDAVLVGPYDLSGSMGIPGKFDNEDFIKALDEINKKVRANGITMGIHEVHPTPELIKGYVEKGYQFIACGIDTLFINDYSRKLVEEMFK